MAANNAKKPPLRTTDMSSQNSEYLSPILIVSSSPQGSLPIGVFSPERKARLVRLLRPSFACPSLTSVPVRYSHSQVASREICVAETRLLDELKLRRGLRIKAFRGPVATMKALAETPLSRLEAAIRREKLRDVLRMKEETEQRLLSLNETATLITQGDLRGLGRNSPALTYEIKDRDRRNWRDKVEKKQTEALEFINKMRNKEFAWRKRNQEREALATRQHEEASAQKSEELRTHQEESLRLRKERLKKRLEDMRAQREDGLKRQRSLLRQSTQFATTYLYQRAEDRYKQGVEAQEAGTRLNAIRERKEIFKPVAFDDLEEHQRNHEQYLKTKAEERMKMILKIREEQRTIMRNQLQFKTKTAERLRKMDSRRKAEAGRKQLENRGRRQKMQNYSSLVREMFPVKPSEEKAAELLRLIQEQKQVPRQPLDVRKDYDPKKLSRRRIMSRSVINAGHREDPGDEYQAVSTKSAAKKIDYLTDMRRRREESYKRLEPRSTRSLRLETTNLQLDSREKLEEFERRANWVELQARRKEKFMNLSADNLELGESVTSMFIDAIKAKLAILDKL